MSKTERVIKLTLWVNSVYIMESYVTTINNFNNNRVIIYIIYITELHIPNRVIIYIIYNNN